MPELTIPLRSHEEAILVLGPYDRYARLLRQDLDIEIFARAGNLRLKGADDGIRAVARIAAEVNSEIENIGARRLQTVMEKLLEEVSFDAEDRSGSTLVIDAAYVDGQLASVARNTDLSRYVL